MEIDLTHPTQRADRRHPPNLGLEPSGEKEQRKTSSGMDTNSESGAKDFQHDLAERRRRRQMEVCIQGRSSRGKEIKGIGK